MAGQEKSIETLNSIVHSQQEVIDKLKSTVHNHETILKLVCNIFKVQKFKKNEVKSLVDTLDSLVFVDYESNKAREAQNGKRKSELNPPVKKVLFNSLKQARLDHKLQLLQKTQLAESEPSITPSSIISQDLLKNHPKQTLPILEKDDSKLELSNLLLLKQLKSQLSEVLEVPEVPLENSSRKTIETNEQQQDEDGFVYIKKKLATGFSHPSQENIIPIQTSFSTSPHRDTYRSKSSRTQLTGYSCPECSGFFDALSKHHDRQKLMNLCSDHKYKYPPSHTPPEYYTLKTHQNSEDL